MTNLCTRLLALLVFLPMLGFGQVAYQLSPVPHQQFFDNNGNPLAGGFIYSYSAGSSTPLATYKDNIGTANTNPIILDAGGFATIYLGQNSYKYCVQNSSAVQQWCQDNVQNISQVLLTTANTWTLGQTFNALINFLGGTSDTTAAEGNVFYRTDLHRLRWYDAGSASWHSVTGDDDTATLTNKTYDTAGSGNVFKINGTQVSAVTGTGSAVLGTSPTVTGPIINTSFANSGTGFKHVRSGTTCTTAASAGAMCTTAAINWSGSAFADNAYTLVCTLQGAITNVPVVQTTAKSPGSFTVTIAAITAAAASYAEVDCIGVHD